jgi:hypothetical protein
MEEIYNKLAIEWNYYIEDRDNYAKNLYKRMNFDKHIGKIECKLEEKIIHMYTHLNNGVALHSRKVAIVNNIVDFSDKIQPNKGHVLIGLVNNSNIPIEYEILLIRPNRLTRLNRLYRLNKYNPISLGKYILNPGIPILVCKDIILHYPFLSTILIKVISYETNIPSLEIIDGWVDIKDTKLLHSISTKFKIDKLLSILVHDEYGYCIGYDLPYKISDNILTAPNFKDIYDNLPIIQKKRTKKRQEIFIEELIVKTCHPSRLNQI